MSSREGSARIDATSHVSHALAGRRSLAETRDPTGHSNISPASVYNCDSLTPVPAATCRYLPGVIANVCHKAGSAMMPFKGTGLTAGRKPMSTYRRQTGQLHGHNWYMPNVRKTREFRHVVIDTNYWKSFVHARLATEPGDKGCFTLFGSTESRHRLFADHVAGSESSTRTEGHGRVVQEWRLRPGAPDNHWLDCLVGCTVAASMLGATLPSLEPARQQRRKRHTQADLRRK